MNVIKLPIRWVVPVILSIVLISVSVAYLYRSSLRIAGSTVTARLSSSSAAQFPDVKTAGFSDQQLKLLHVLKSEYAKKPVSYDANVLKYTQGEKQAWCADFVSWAMSEVGRPFANPNSRSWRIPGVYTLREYFQSQNRYKLAGDYAPTFGDVAVYAKTPTNSHTNIVLSVDTKAKTMTLIGGNENGRVRIIQNQSYVAGVRDLVGFGVRQLN